MKRGFQIVVGILSLIPIYYGGMGMITGAAGLMPAEAVTPAIDSQYRFLSAVYLGLGAMIMWLLPNIDKQATLFRIIVAILFLGGLARLYSYVSVGAPPANFVFGIVLELCLPLLILWHNKIRE